MKFRDYVPFFLQNIWVLRGILAAMTLGLNSVMLTLTANALQLCKTTVQSVITTSAVNFLTTVSFFPRYNSIENVENDNILQAVLGHLFLGEHIGWSGIFGMMLIQLGVFIVSKDKEKIN